jgi:methionine-rich copper-binding protein CopC
MQSGFKAHASQAAIQSRTVFYWLMIAAMLLVHPDRAWAHAVIVDSTPVANGVVKGPELEIKLRFNARIDGGRSKLTLISPDGNARAIALAQQTSPDLLMAKAAHLVPGKYQLRWQVLASDGHITQGSIPFSVVNP